mmetsp:Transcript_10870/g.23904  ORF Transcript_10870/g.23904 Transcript_10870/m.23904 type:complete len:264 (-) Transcript_10870:624-1415(-)
MALHEPVVLLVLVVGLKHLLLEFVPLELFVLYFDVYAVPVFFGPKLFAHPNADWNQHSNHQSAQQAQVVHDDPDVALEREQQHADHDLHNIVDIELLLVQCERVEEEVASDEDLQRNQSHLLEHTQDFDDIAKYVLAEGGTHHEQHILGGVLQIIIGILITNFVIAVLLPEEPKQPASELGQGHQCESYDCIALHGVETIVAADDGHDEWVHNESCYHGPHQEKLVGLRSILGPDQLDFADVVEVDDATPRQPDQNQNDHERA